jgi:outer membrane receptor protein involved in Fe transport
MPATQANDAPLEEVIVTAEYRPVPVLELPTSVTIFDQQAIDRRDAVHLEQLLNLAPNVNLSSGASRGRFVQIRGIGERSQFVEPVNPSVGLVIDGMDFTGIGGAASTLDIQQVEILRGPQGTLFGANALAGLINMVSNEPGDELNGRADLTLGNYNRITAMTLFHWIITATPTRTNPVTTHLRAWQLLSVPPGRPLTHWHLKRC